MANKKFTSIKNDFSLIFDQSTEIEEAKDDVQINKSGFSFSDIQTIQQLMANHNVDVIGIVTEITPVGQINAKDGSKRDKRSLTIADDTNFSISLTIWGEAALNIDPKIG